MASLARTPLILTLCCSALPTPALAWGDDGHRVIALVARHYLAPTTAAQVDELLSGPALPSRPDDRASVPLFMAERATWADKYRDSDRRDVSDSRYRMTREWHFVDLEIDAPDIDAACFGHPTPNRPFPGRPDNCVVDKIRQFTAVLADPSSAHDDKVVALEFLLHLVGDVHQPLHAADHHDQGGNTVKVRHNFIENGKRRSRTINLHSYWDKVVVSRLGSSPETIAANLVLDIPKRPTGAWAETDPAAWAQQSSAVAKTKAYKLRQPTAEGVIPLSSTYATAATGAARKQLQLAGYRLAGLLNRALR